ncbi:MAG: heme exporter protein CcmD [Brevirhabdus sp.]
MIPDLGKYAVEVLSAYAASIVMLVVLVAMSLRRSSVMRRKLKETEERQKRDG